MSLCGKSEVVVNTSQRKPTLLRRGTTRRPAQRLEHTVIAAIDIGEIHGQIPGSGLEHCAKFGSESLRSVVIEMTPQNHAGIPAATPHGDNCQPSRILHRAPPALTGQCRQGPGQHIAPAQPGSPPSNRHTPRQEVDGLVASVRLRILRIHIIRDPLSCASGSSARDDES